jgi:hypothetical protein
VSSDLWNGSAVLLPHQQVMLARGAEDKKQPCRIWVFSDQIAMSVSHVRFPPYSDRKAAIAGGRLRAIRYTQFLREAFAGNANPR